MLFLPVENITFYTHTNLTGSSNSDFYGYRGQFRGRRGLGRGQFKGRRYERGKGNGRMHGRGQTKGRRLLKGQYD